MKKGTPAVKKILMVLLTLVFLGLLLFSFLIAEGGVQRPLDALTAWFKSEDVESLLQEISEQMNKDLPRTENEVRFDSVSVEQGNSMVYTYVLTNHTSEQINTEILQPDAAKSFVMETVCEPSGMLPILKKGVTLKYEYIANDGPLLTSFVITLADCLHTQN